MKRLISLALVLAMAVTLLAGCGGKSGKKTNLVSTEEISQEMMETLADFMPEIAESAKYEFKELTATWGDVPIHFLFIVKERFNGVNDGNLWMDMWNLFVMDLDDGNVYHVKNRNYWQAMSPGKAEASSQAIWNYEMFCTGQWETLIDENEVWTDIVTEEDFAALQQRSNAKLPEARNVLTVEKAEMVSSTNPHDRSEMNVMYVQVRNHAAPMEEYQQEWYAIDLDRDTLYDNYELKASHFDSLPEDAGNYLSDVRYKYSSRVYDGYILREETEIWDTMFEEHIEALNEQLLTGPVPQPMKPVPQNVTTYEIEGFSEHQNMLASLLNWFGMEGVSGVGISFGADRIYDVMNQLDLYPKESIHTTKVMFVNFGDREALHSLKIIGELRKAGISAELFPSSDKMKKQMSYANSHSIPFVAIIGEQEMTDNTIALKNMITGEQKTVTAEELKEILA